MSAIDLQSQTTLTGSSGRSRQPRIHGIPVNCAQPGVDVLRSGCLKVQEVGVLVNVESQYEVAIPSREAILRVADEVKDTLLIAVIGQERPSPPRKAGDLHVRCPLVERAIGVVDERRDLARCRTAISPDGVEVDVVVLVSSVRERIVDLQRSRLAVDRIAFLGVSVQCGKELSNLIGLVCVALP